MSSRRVRGQARRDLRAAVFARDGWRCVWCGAGVDLVAHHVRPLAIGGGNEVANLVTLCDHHHTALERLATLAAALLTWLISAVMLWLVGVRFRFR